MTCLRALVCLCVLATMGCGDPAELATSGTWGCRSVEYLESTPGTDATICLCSRSPDQGTDESGRTTYHDGACPVMTKCWYFVDDLNCACLEPDDDSFSMEDAHSYLRGWGELIEVPQCGS